MEEFRLKYLRTRFSTIRGVYGEFAAACEEQNLRCPSEKTFQRHVNQTPASDLLKARKGNRPWRQEFRRSTRHVQGRGHAAAGGGNRQHAF